MTARRWAWRAGSVLVCVVLVLAWQAAADARLVPPVFLPGPDKVWRALQRGMASGVLPEKLAGTVLRMIEGWVVASLLGVGLGTLIGASQAARAWLGPKIGRASCRERV